MPENTSAVVLTSEQIATAIADSTAQRQDPTSETPVQTPAAAAPRVEHIAPADQLGQPVEEKRYLDQTNYIRELERQKNEMAEQLASQEGVPSSWTEEAETKVPDLSQAADTSLAADTRSLRKEIATAEFTVKHKVDEATDLEMRKLIFRDDPTLKAIWDQNPRAALKIAHKMVKADQLEAQLNQTVPVDNPVARLNAKSEQDLGHQTPTGPLTKDDLTGLSSAEQEKLILAQYQ